MSISFSALYSKFRTGRRLIDLGTEGTWQFASRYEASVQKRGPF